jgi:protein-S-isoprenylcysteine O-methyltransferase Ste14
VSIIARFTLIFSVSAITAGLVVLGVGGLGPFLSHPPLIALAIVIGLMVVASLFSSGNLSSGEREDRGNRWVLVAFALIMMMICYLPAYSDRIDFWTIDADTTRWLGVILFAAGGTLRLWPVFVLGRRFSGLVAIQPGHTLVTDGIYGIIRNPSYLGMIVSAVGWGLAFRSVVGLLLAAFLIPPLVARIHAEEAMLRSQFGGEYESYCAHTWRLIPGLY